MNQTNYIILKLLLQQSLEEKEILKYLNLNIFTLRKSIIQLNNKLSNLNLPNIEQINTIYKIRLSQFQKNIFYLSCSEYSQEQRCIYLTLKLLINKNLNLENEKDNLNISRATIDRDITLVKNRLIERKISVISIKWKGLFLNILDKNNYYEYICELLVVLYFEYKYLPGILKLFLLNLQKYEIEYLIFEFFNIYDEFNLQIGNSSLQYFLALNVCFNLFSDFYLSNVLSYIKVIFQNIEFQNIYNVLISKFHLKNNYALYIAMNIYDVQYKKFFLEESYKSKITSYCNFFNIALTCKSYHMLMFFLFISDFRYKHNLYEVKNIYLKSSFDEILLEYLLKFLRNNDTKLLYGDLLELLDFTKFFLLKTNKKKIKKILILKKDINIIYFSDLKHSLKSMYPNFIFDIKPHAYTYLLKKQTTIYDLILSDIILDIDLKYKLCQVNTSLNSSINEYLIEDMLNSIKSDN